MMDENPDRLADIIAERVVDTSSGPVSLVFFRPTCSGATWNCRFSISGMAGARDIESASSGRDSLEALMLAIVAASMFFYDSSTLSEMSVFGDREIGLLKTTEATNGDLESTFTLSAPKR
ncbi:hypothetical protein [Nocardia sp. CS682]|uniref:DUF6968 family protein n=1 Tax=Nocardia sp. CS682 TaxID=1047172 RepID=UPI0010755AFA|nr:hypothetical protein [Nocardia sp. CS682]